MTLPLETSRICQACAAELAPTLLACPRCGGLVHSQRLESLATEAHEATAREDFPTALAAWREAIELLPRESKQYAIVNRKIDELSAKGGTAPAPKSPPKHSTPAGKAAAGMGALGLLLWKFKVIILFALTKGKLLLLGLTKATTFLSMLLSFAAYWSLWGWKFALGLVLSIYVHEMGHVVALRRHGFKATAPLFVPGLGAFIRLQQRIDNPRHDAAIGLAGPVYGLIAALASLGLWLIFKHPVLLAIAGLGAWINLFNLMPVWTLDGGRAFHAMSRPQRWTSAAAMATGFAISRDAFVAILAVIVLLRALEPGDKEGDWRATWTYVALVLVLSTICLLNAPLAQHHR
jgi:Zn-dependent protease